MYDLGPIPARQALEFLESEEVQHALASLFQGTQTKEGKKAIEDQGFWTFASGNIKEAKLPSAQAQLLYSLYSQLKEYLESNEGQGNIPFFDYNSKWEKAREHIHTKLKGEGLPAGQIIIEIVVPRNKPGYRLSVMPSIQAAQAVRSREGPTPKEQLVESNAISRRALQIHRSTTLFLPRPDIANKIEKALSDNLADVLILPGGFQSGKSTWMLDFHQRNRRFTAYHPFCENDVELQQEPYFAESLAVQLVALAGVTSASKPARRIDSFVKLADFIATLRPKLDGQNFLILLDGMDQAGELLGRIIALLRQYLQSDNHSLRWIVTVRAPSPALQALSDLPHSSILPAFDDKSCVIESIQSYLEIATCDFPNPKVLAGEIYDQAGSNRSLMHQVAHCLQETRHTEKSQNINMTSIARECLSRTRQACSDKEWKDLLQLLQTLALLPEDSPPTLLQLLTGWDSHSMARVASLAPEIIQSVPTGHCILRPLCLRKAVLHPPITSPDAVVMLQHDLAKRCVQFITQDSAEGSHCRRVFARLVLSLRDPRMCLDLISDSALRILRTHPGTTPEDLQMLLRCRAECSLRLHPDNCPEKHILAAATLAESNRRTAERGDIILSLWQSRASFEHVIPYLRFSLTEPSIIELIAAAEAAAVKGSPALIAKLVETCADLENQLRENAGDAILSVLKPAWGHRYAGGVVAQLALTDSQTALAMHYLFLSAVKKRSHTGPVFDYCAQLLTVLDGRKKAFCLEVLNSTAHTACENEPDLMGPLGRIEQLLGLDEISAGDNEHTCQAEMRRSLYADAANILETVKGKSRAACAPELRKHLNTCWKLKSPSTSTLIKDIMAYFRATGIMPKSLERKLRNSVTEMLSRDFEVHRAGYHNCCELFDAAEYLANEVENHGAVQLVIDRFLKIPIDQVLLLWADMGNRELCATALSLAFRVGDDCLKDTWNRMWKATGKLRKLEGVPVRMTGLSLLLHHGSAVGCDWLNELMVRQLLRLRIPSEQKAALRASMEVPPVDGADYDRCLTILHSLNPVSSPILGTIPDSEALALFLACCIEQPGFHTQDMARHLLGLIERFGIRPHDQESFLRIFLKNISDFRTRRNMLHAMRGMHTADEHARLCLAIEERCPGTLRAKDVDEVNLSKISGIDFLLYTGVIMAESKEHRALLLTRLPSISEVSKRAMLIHQYVIAEGCGPVLDCPPSTLEPLPTDRIACAAMEQVKQMDVETLQALEQHMSFDLEGFRVLHAASQKVEGTLPDEFIKRQVERLFPSLWLTGQRQSKNTIDQTQSQKGFNYYDGKGLAEELLRCGDKEIRNDLFSKIAQEISSCGRWISVGFLDTANKILRERTLKEPLLSTIRCFPLAFEERYHSAFYGRLIRYLGEANQTVRDELWFQASALWFVPDESTLKRAGFFSKALGVLTPEDTPAGYVAILRQQLDELLATARRAGTVHLFGVLALLLKDMEAWLETFQDLITVAFGELLDDLLDFEHDVPELMMKDFLSGLSSVTKTEMGVAFISDVCSVKPSRWEVFMSRLAGRRDDAGDLSTWSMEISKNIIARVWPSDPAAHLWIDSFKARGGEDTMWLIKEYTHSMVIGPGGAKWADLCNALIDGIEPEAPPEEWLQLEKYCKTWTSLIHELHTPEDKEGSAPFLITESKDYERFLLCMRDGPDPAEQKTGAQWLVKQVFTEDPEIMGSETSRTAILKAVGKVFADHPWKQALADAFLEVAEAEPSIAQRFNLMILAAVSLKSASILRGACNLLTDRSIAECMPGATKVDLAFAIQAGSAFQFRSLYPTTDSDKIAESEELSSLQKQAWAYRTLVLDEEQRNGTEDHLWTSAQAFAEGLKWAHNFATAAEACLADVTPANIPIPYWWRIARCARLTGSTHLLQLLCRLRNACEPATLISPEIEREILSILIASAESPQFPELYGYAQAFLIGKRPACDGSYASLLTELPLRLSNVCSMLT